MNAPLQMLKVVGRPSSLIWRANRVARLGDTRSPCHRFATNRLALPFAQYARWKRARVISSIAGILFGLSSYGVSAAPIALTPAPASVSADLFFNFTPPAPLHVSTFGRHDLTHDLSGSRAFVDAGRTPSPFLFVSAPRIFDFVFGRVAGVLDYEFVITGPAGSVPVVAVAAGEAQAGTERPPLASGSFALQAAWSLSEAISGTTVFSDDAIHTPSLNGSFSDSFHHTKLLDLKTNERYRVRLIADAAVANGSDQFGPSFAFARIDPVFSFASGVGPEFSFVFSEGIGNAPPDSGVPEPGTLGLVGVSFLALCVAALRRGQAREEIAQ